MTNAPPSGSPTNGPDATEGLAAPGSSRDTGLSGEEARVRLAREGANDVPERTRHPLLQFARRFWGLSAWMLELIAALSLVLHKQADFWIAIALLAVNALLSFLQEQRAATALAALRSRLRVTARVLRDGAWRTVPARELVRGDVVRLRSGDFVPADVRIVSGELRIDQAALTGESRELVRSADEALFSGSVVRDGEATAEVTATGINTYFGRTTQLVESAAPRLHIESVIARIVRWMFVIVAVPVLVTVAVSLVRGGDLFEVLPLSLVLLMGAVPVALPVMFTVSMAVGSMKLARRGVLVTRLSATEDAATVDVICVDKTGTLTMNRLTLAGTEPRPGYTVDDVIRDGALASQEADQDPIDLAFLGAARDHGLLAGSPAALSFIPFSPATRRTEAVVERGGRRVRLVKGALRTVGEAAGLDAPSVAALEARAGAEAGKGFRVLAVARAEEDAPLALVGLAFLHDAPRPDSRLFIDELKSLGVNVKMLTGDALPVAQEVARELGLGEVVRAPELRAASGGPDSQLGRLIRDSNGFAEVFPEDKFLVVRCLQEAGATVAMTGDGVNDAPALRQAEVGIAVASATDVAKGAASVVLTAEGLASIVDLIRNGRAVYERVLTWVINKVSRTILKSGLVVVAFLVTGEFVISALGMILVTFMTDFVKVALSTDEALPTQKPESWNIGPLVALAVLLGVLMLAEALALLFVGWHVFGLGGDPGRLQTFTFQTLLFFALFSIVSIRERRAWWASRPGWILCAALGADACAGMAVGVFGLGELRPLPITETAVVAAYALVLSLLVNDAVKVAFLTRFWRLARLEEARGNRARGPG